MRLSLTCALLGVVVFLYPVFLAPSVASLALAGGAMASLILGLVTSRWLGAGLAAGLALLNYSLALGPGHRPPDIYAPPLAVAGWLLLELFDLAVMARKQGLIDNEVFDAHRRRLVTTSAGAGIASVAVLLTGALFQAHPGLLPAAAVAAAGAVVAAVVLTQRAVNLVSGRQRLPRT